jgi:DNA (cytosine-5)-methyltransferase 1
MRSIELFAGCGGLAKGLELAGFKHSALLEINHQACESLRANYNPSIVHEVDVKKVDFRVFEGIDVISGGPPCQPFSLGGLSKAYEDSRDMFPQASR